MQIETWVREASLNENKTAKNEGSRSLPLRKGTESKIMTFLKGEDDYLRLYGHIR